MSHEHERETKGAWIVHHSRKILTDTHAPAEYSALDEAGKAAELLMKLGETAEANLKGPEVEAIAKAANLNPRTELPHYLGLLKNKRLIDTSGDEVQVLGINTRGVLGHAADIFDNSNPKSHEVAAINLGELASTSPIALKDAKTYIGDTFEMDTENTTEFLRRATEIGFVDQEGDDPSNILLFNGNLFKRDSVAKASKVLSSLSSAEQSALGEITEQLSSVGCLHATACEKRLGQALFGKLKASGVLEVNTVSNEEGDHAFVTLPGAFHKFVNPLIDDTFDMAKALVAALTYGVQLRPASQGRILSVEWILGALNRGDTVGPATAIGADYRVLEQNRVVKLFPAHRGMFRMKLLKMEVGLLALEVLKRGDANAETLNALPAAPMSNFYGPEYSREITRKKQSRPSKQHTHDILSALRGGRGI
jgi:hypothetical protein